MSTKRWIAVQVDEDVHQHLTEQARKKDLALAQHVRRVLMKATLS